MDALVLAERLFAAVGLGAVIGLEREIREKAAGVSTHAMLALGACAFALVSVDAFPRGTDPARVVAQIVTGVGFLGAGTIIRSGGSVRGLTTAATLWVVAAVGTACGVGYVGPAAAITALAVASLVLLRLVKDQVRRRVGEHAEITVTTSGMGEDISDVLVVVGHSPAKVAHMEISRDEDGEGRTFIITVDARQQDTVTTLMEQLGRVPKVGRVNLNEL